MQLAVAWLFDITPLAYRRRTPQVLARQALREIPSIVGQAGEDALRVTGDGYPRQVATWRLCRSDTSTDSGSRKTPCQTAPSAEFVLPSILPPPRCSPNPHGLTVLTQELNLAQPTEEIATSVTIRRYLASVWPRSTQETANCEVHSVAHT